MGSHGTPGCAAVPPCVQPSRIKRQLLRPRCASCSLPSSTPASVVGQPGAPVPRTPVHLRDHQNLFFLASRDPRRLFQPWHLQPFPSRAAPGVTAAQSLGGAGRGVGAVPGLSHARPAAIFPPSRKKVAGAGRSGSGRAGPGATAQPPPGAPRGRRGQRRLLCLSCFLHGKRSSGLGTSFLPTSEFVGMRSDSAWLWI